MGDEAGDAVDGVDAVQALVPGIRARADEIEKARRVPPDLVAQLVDAGCFRALVSRSHGGAELDPPAHMRVIEELARADGSVGWTVMIGSAAPVVLGLLPRETFDAVYSRGTDVVLGGAFNPTGVATPVDGGFRATGRWSFASGCQHAHWFVAHCLGDDGREPPVRLMLLEPDDVEISDTWTVSGLCGTGSHDFAVTDVLVPAERSFTLEDDACLDGPLHRIPELALSTLDCGAVAVGIAERALDEILALATGKVPAFAETTLAAATERRLGSLPIRVRRCSSTAHEASQICTLAEPQLGGDAVRSVTSV